MKKWKIYLFNNNLIIINISEYGDMISNICLSFCVWCLVKCNNNNDDDDVYNIVQYHHLVIFMCSS